MHRWVGGHLVFHLLCIGLVEFCSQGSKAEPFGLRLIHKFSDEATAIMQQRVGGNLGSWPSTGSVQFYHMLHKHDRARQERKLSSQDNLTFSMGIRTTQLGDQFGWLYYTMVDVGTPNKTFLVALDTGSDLFWVPCQCKECANRSAPGYPNLEQYLNVYSPTESSTSKPVTCSNSLCDLRNSCLNGTDQCPYTVQYLSTNTSTTGVLVEDVMYFSKGSVSQASMIFGCGQVQTGIFLEGGPPDGLLGLGLSQISIPSFLARSGLVPNSFSMCFGPDLSGQILFGDRGDPTMQTTPFVRMNDSYRFYFYAVELEQILVGNEIIGLQLAMVFDTGTTFTYFPPDIYDAVTRAFDFQVPLQRIPTAEISAPFDFCYATSASGEVAVPDISFTFSGKGNFSVLNPYVFLVDENNETAGVCLTVLSSVVPIIGQNFMTGYSIVFDRNLSSLGWWPSNCSEESGGGAPPASPEPIFIPISSPSEKASPPPTATHLPFKSPSSSEGSSPSTLVAWKEANFSLGFMVLLLLYMSFS